MYLTSSVKAPVQWHFIDRATYSSLREGPKALTLTDFVNVGCGVSPAHNKLSHSTLKYVLEMNRRIRYVLFGEDIVKCEALDDVASDMYSYLKEQLAEFLDAEVTDCSSFYEILPIDDKSFLVVVENGFLNYTTQSKDTFKEFVLACLGYLDRFKCDPVHLNQLYLRLSFIKGYHLLVRARAAS